MKNFNYQFYFSIYRLKREEGGGQIIIQAMAQPQQLQQIQQQTVEQRQMDHDEKKMRRQIANSNERRRMQSINAGFQSLRQLLPHHEGEKLSKVSVVKLNENNKTRRVLSHQPRNKNVFIYIFLPIL